MSAPQWAAVDEATGDLLDLIQADWLPFADDDRNAIAYAIREDARRHDGHVSSNRVRAAITRQVAPHRVGPVYRALCLAGVLRVDGWETSDDTKGRNSGKPCRTYRWTGDLS